jgi:hypothetical protein
MKFFNMTTDITLMFLAGLEILGTFPPKLTQAYMPMWVAANAPGDSPHREKEAAAAAALLTWATNLTSDSPAIACLPEELRMVLPRTFGINMSERPAGPLDYQRMACFQKYIGKTYAAMDQHSAAIYEQCRTI